MMEDMIAAYRQASQRLLLLDYDGTLAELKPTPQEATPTPRIIAALQRLGNDPKNTIVVVSGRRHEELETWLGVLSISFAAEHGLLLKQRGQGWQLAAHIDTSWKSAIAAVMQPYVQSVKGSLVEDKTNALVWHYRNASDQNQAEESQAQLVAELQPFLKQFGLRILLGSKVVEVQPPGIHKGLAAKHWLNQNGWDFVLAAGDDTTDEDMFKAMPPVAFTIKVREGSSQARIRIATPAKMLELLGSL
jgi:trehalose 6-phosphate synthase/phosphatase